MAKRSGLASMSPFRARRVQRTPCGLSLTATVPPTRNAAATMGTVGGGGDALGVVAVADGDVHRRFRRRSSLGTMSPRSVIHPTGSLSSQTRPMIWRCSMPPTGQSSICADCATADQPTPGTSPSSGPATTTTTTPSSQTACSPVAPKTPSIVPAASTSTTRPRGFQIHRRTNARDH